jgi:hypothetical protein
MPTKVGIHDFGYREEDVDGRPSPTMTVGWKERSQ